MSFVIHMIDVFGSGPLSGNPLAVVIGADALSTDEMQGLTRWFNLSETTFLLQPTHPQADYRVRIFSLDRELPFAGHPTLGSCHAGSPPTACQKIKPPLFRNAVRDWSRSGARMGDFVLPLRRLSVPAHRRRPNWKRRGSC